MSSNDKFAPKSSKADALKAAESKARAFANSMSKTLQETRDLLLDIECRVLTGARLDQAVWKIWGQFRSDPKSLDSERQCRLIRETIVAAVADVQAELESARRDNKRLKEQRQELRAQLKELTEKTV